MVIRTGWLVENRKTEKYGGGLDDFYLAVWIEDCNVGFRALWCAGQNFLTCDITCNFKLPILTHGKLYRRAIIEAETRQKGRERAEFAF